MSIEIKNHFLKEFGNDIQITTVEFETKTGTLTMTVEDLFNWVENCHKAKVNSITDEEISVESTKHLHESEYKKQCREYARIGSMKLRNKLLKQ